MYFTKCKNTFILFLKNAHTVYTSLLLFARLSHLILSTFAYICLVHIHVFPSYLFRRIGTRTIGCSYTNLSEITRMETMNHLLLILMLVYRIVGVQSLSNGAPVENCRSMRPQHDFQHDPNAPVLPEIDPSPFTFEASESYRNSTNSIFNG